MVSHHMPLYFSPYCNISEYVSMLSCCSFTPVSKCHEIKPEIQYN